MLELLRCLPYHYFYLYRSSGNNRERFIGPKNFPSQSLDFAPIDEVTENNYDSLWIRIPYGPDWDPVKVKAFVDDVVSDMHTVIGLVWDFAQL